MESITMADEKKLIVDEDWKSQVQAEKAAAAKEAQAAAPNSAGQRAAAGPGAPDPGDIPMPPASLEMLLTTLATEALMALGQVPHPADGQTHVHRNQAQYLINTIDVLRQKTKGNLTPDEERMIDSVLHQLRMVFIETAGTQSSNST